MRIRCTCGQKYNIKDELAGQYVRCRKCGEHVLVQSHDQPFQAAPVTRSRPAAHPPTQRSTHPPTQSPVAGNQPPAVQSLGQGLSPDDPNSLGGVTDSQMSMGPAHQAVQSQAAHFPAKRGARKPISKHAKLDFSYVNLGLKLIFAGITISLSCSMFAMLFFAGGVLSIGGLLLFGAFVGNLMSMIGYIFCIWVPGQTESRPLIIAANVCNAINVFVSLGAALYSVSNSGQNTPLFDFVSMVVTIATVILFLLFLKKVSLYVGDTNAAENAWSLLIFFVSVGGIAALFMLSMVFILPILPVKMRGIYVIVGILTIVIVLFIWLIHFLKFIDDLEFRKKNRRR